MEKFLVWCEASKLYVEEVLPSTDTLLLTSLRGKARSYFKAEADQVCTYLKRSTGMSFELLDA
jgi:hypothetical protein